MLGSRVLQHRAHRAPGGTYTIAELTVDVRLCLLWGDVRLVITRRNGDSVRAERDGDGTDPAGADRAGGAAPLPAQGLLRGQCPGVRGRSVGARR